MKYSAVVAVKGNTYSISVNAKTGDVNCINCGTLRAITSAKTLAMIFAAWAEQAHDEALELGAILCKKELKEIARKENAEREEWRAKRVEEAHAEALEMNANYESADQLAREFMIECDHAEALEMNAESDRRRADSIRRSLVTALEESGELEALVEACHAEALEINKSFDEDSILKQFASVAPYILESVKARLAGNETEEATIAIIHQEILNYFEASMNMALQYMAFNTDQRRAFAGIMYDLLAPMARKNKTTLNPVYEKFVKETGKTSVLDFICHTPSADDDPVFSVYQRADGMQLAVDANGSARYMRPFKQANWLCAGFEARLDYYWLVERGVKINPEPNAIALFEDGILITEEAEHE